MQSDKSNARDLIFLVPEFHGKLWGGRRLEEDYGYELPDGPVGECWAISAHPNGDCKIAGGEWDGQNLSTLWADHRELFGNAEGDEFPLLNGFSRKDISDMLVYHGYSGDDGNVNTVIRFMENENTDDFRRCQKDAADFVSTVIYVQAQSEQGAKRADTPA
jgi:hypothetical protein